MAEYLKQLLRVGGDKIHDDKLKLKGSRKFGKVWKDKLRNGRPGLWEYMLHVLQPDTETIGKTSCIANSLSISCANKIKLREPPSFVSRTYQELPADMELATKNTQACYG